MQAIGIICEYNPFHNGHKYHIEQVRTRFPDACIVAIMSGHFVQRGEPAFINKFLRTKMALDYVDLVVELPQMYAASFADDFAHGGILIAKFLGLDGLSFGSERGMLIDEHLEQPANVRSGLSFPKLMNAGLKSNDILGHAYSRAAREIYPSLKLIPIKRLGNDYLEQQLTGEISSATAIRKSYFSGESVSSTMPSTELIDHAVRFEDYFVLLKYRILSMEVSELGQIYTMYEGLENRLKKVINTVDSFEELIDSMVSKRYTRSRIQRLLTYVLLNIKEYDVPQLKKVNALRVLGMNDKGRAWIKGIQDIEIVTNVNKNNKHHFELEIKATEIYNLVSLSTMTDFNTPVIYKKK